MRPAPIVPRTPDAHRRPRAAGGTLIALLLIGAALLPGCSFFEEDDPTLPPARIQSVRLVDSQTVPGLGTGQGIAVRDGLVYLYGDAETGVIREYRLIWAAPPYLEPTGRAITLTVDGNDVAPNPTGLTFHNEYGTYLGSTVAGKGTLHRIDFDRALNQGTLDGCILNTILDDAAAGGTRPEFIRLAGRWLIATADDGETDNRIRLYEPGPLATAERTTDPGVLADSYPCPPRVRALHWLDEPETLVLVQDRGAEPGTRLTTVRLDGKKDLRRARGLALKQPADTLRGFALLGNQRSILVSGSPERNAWFAVVRLRDLAAEERAKELQRQRRPYNPVTGTR